MPSLSSPQYHTAWSHSILRGVNTHLLKLLHRPLKGEYHKNKYIGIQIKLKKGYIFHFCTNVLGLNFFFFILKFEYLGENETKNEIF